MSQTLITRLSKLDAPDREVDAEIDVLFFGGETVWKQANYTMEQFPTSKRDSKHHICGYAYEHVPAYTASVDAAIALAERVLPGWGWELASNTSHIKNCLNPEYGNPVGKHPHWAAVANQSSRKFVDGATPAIALLIALLRAKEASNG